MPRRTFLRSSNLRITVLSTAARCFWFLQERKWGVIAIVGLAVLLILRTDVRMAHNSGAREALSRKLRAISAKCLDGSGTISRNTIVSSACANLFDSSGMERSDFEALNLIDSYGVSVSWHYARKRHKCRFFPVPTPDAILLWKEESYLPKSVVPLLVMTPIIEADHTTLPLLRNTDNSGSASISDVQRKMIRHRLSVFEIEYACALFVDGSVRFLPVTEL